MPSRKTKLSSKPRKNRAPQPPANLKSPKLLPKKPAPQNSTKSLPAPKISTPPSPPKPAVASPPISRANSPAPATFINRSPVNPNALTPAQPPPPAAPLRPIPATGPGKASAAGHKFGVAVVGSLNIDLVCRTETMPAPGQTVLGQDLKQSPGGKGANQATAVGRLWQRRSAGAKLIGRIGDDLFGQKILESLRAAKVDAEAVSTTRNTPTGSAMITIDRHGENAIVVAGGANRMLTAGDMLAQRKTIESSVVLVAQLEVPADTVACAFALAKRSGVLTILDPAPAPPEGLPESLHHVDVLTPNQSEAQLLTGITIRTPDDARRAGERFLARGTRIVIIKMGSQGAVVVHRQDAQVNGEAIVVGGHAAGGAIGPGSATLMQHIPGFRVPVTDTTAAGDAFTGALAVALAEGMPLTQAVRFANAAGALACTRMGAIQAMPLRAEVELLLAGNWPPK